MKDYILSIIHTIDSTSIKIFILSMLPVTELRLSIPFGILKYNLHWLEAALLSIIGNVIIGILIIYILAPLMNIFRKAPFLNSLVEYIFKRTLKKSTIINNLKFYGLILFIGLPLPMTGVWTGALASYLFGLSKIKSSIAVVAGVIISSVIVTLLTIFGQYSL